MRYKSQVLAIVLVILVIGTIIGFGLYARSIREAERLVGERAAAEANEFVETAIGVIGSADFLDVVSGSVLAEFPANCIEQPDGCRKFDIPTDDFSNLLSKMIPGDVDFTDFDRDVEGFCKGEIMLRYASQDDEIIIEKDETYSLFFKPETSWEGAGRCVAKFHMDKSDHPPPFGFIISTFYKDTSSQAYKDYKHKDINGFRYGGASGNWKAYSPGSALEFQSANYAGQIGSAKLHEVRFTSVGGRSVLTWSLTGNCQLEDLYLVVEVGATCHDRYVGKFFNVPSEPFAPPIFDYVLFNNEGELTPERIEY